MKNQHYVTELQLEKMIPKIIAFMYNEVNKKTNCIVQNMQVKNHRLRHKYLQFLFTYCTLHVAQTVEALLLKWHDIW